MFKLEILKARVQSLNRTSPKFNNYLHTKIIIYKKYIFTLNTPPLLHCIVYYIKFQIVILNYWIEYSAPLYPILPRSNLFFLKLFTKLNLENRKEKMGVYPVPCASKKLQGYFRNCVGKVCCCLQLKNIACPIQNGTLQSFVGISVLSSIWIFIILNYDFSLQ